VSDSIVFFDLETENHASPGHKSSPHNPDNFIVASGWAYGRDGKVMGEYFQDGEVTLPFLDDPGVDILVAHNAPFDIGWLLSRHRDRFLAFVRRGGKIYCTQLVEYLLSNQQDTYPSLDETAPKYGGSHKVDAVRLSWEQGMLTSEIERDILFDKYLLGPDGDIENVRRVFYGQMSEIVKRGMWRSILQRMDGLLFNVFAMDSGLHINRDTAVSMQREGEDRVKELEVTLERYRGIPDEVGFKVTSRHHVSAWLFGGPITYRFNAPVVDDQGNPVYKKCRGYQFEDGFFIEEHYLDNSEGLLVKLEEEHGCILRYKAGKHKGMPKSVLGNYNEVKTKWEDRVYQCKGLIDLGKLPKDFRDSFTREYTGKQQLSDGTPVYSTSEKAIDDLSGQEGVSEDAMEVLRAMQELFTYEKILGTYYLTQDGKKTSGMLQYLTDYNVVHHSLNATSTVTTRLSSTKPNLQILAQVSDSFPGRTKTLFSTRFDDPVWVSWAVGKGIIPTTLPDELIKIKEKYGRAGSMVAVDFSAIEIVVMAMLSGDSNLIKALKEGTDMHSLRVSKSYGIPYEEVVAAVNDSDHPKHKEYKRLRTDIKPMSFLYAYGGSAEGMVYQLRVSKEFADKFIETEKALFPELEEYFERVLEEVDSTTKLHREQDESGVWRVYGRGYQTMPCGTRFEWRQRPVTVWNNGVKSTTMQYKVPEIRNYSSQGTAALAMQIAVGRVMRTVINNPEWDGKVFLVNQVHDECVLDCTADVAKDVALKVKSVMESVGKVLTWLGYNVQTDFPAVPEIGSTLHDKREID
jgi:hypothetical protein